MGKYELIPETTTTERQTTTTTKLTTTQPTTTSTRKPRRTKTTTTTTIPAVNATTDIPYVIAEEKMSFIPGRDYVIERVPVVDWENKMYLSWIRQGRLDELPFGLYKLYTSTPRILTDSDYYSDSVEIV